jgi:hypothetical protein
MLEEIERQKSNKKQLYNHVASKQDYQPNPYPGFEMLYRTIKHTQALLQHKWLRLLA